jgi:hypothetical protein
MSSNADQQEAIKHFLLVGPDPDPDHTPIPKQRRWWRREGIYLNDICLAVHLSLREIKDDEAAQAKEALYVYLRRVGQTALERELVCPIACVLSPGQYQPSKEFISDLRSWGSDQDWHRGSFTLYVEIPPPDQTPDPEWDHWGRLVDLLNPPLGTLVLPLREMRKLENIVTQLQDDFGKAFTSDPQAAKLARKLLEVIETIIKSYGTRAERSLYEDWVKDILRQADQTAAGE